MKFSIHHSVGISFPAYNFDFGTKLIIHFDNEIVGYVTLVIDLYVLDMSRSTLMSPIV